jgi:hypothetical protein
MPIGICKLCLLTKDLKDSHLMPRSLYKRSRGSDKKGNQECIFKVVFLRSIQAFRYVFSPDVRIFSVSRTGSLGDTFCVEKRFRATIMSCHSGLEPQTPNKNFRNSFFAIPNQFALDQLLESADHLRGVPA